ncbi:MAG TPA: HAD family hydrolase [Candidatus Saccharimonadales bacterium]|nr:HAD family hydrolase [Candidatus Saccharimonadales bacterium]
MKLGAGFFDLDQTLIDRQGVPYEGVEGVLQAIHKTILTGRRYPSLRTVLDQYPSLHITQGMPVAVENGGRIMDWSGRRNILFYPLSDDELTATFGYLASLDSIRYVSFQPEDPQSPINVWVPDSKAAESLPTFPSQTRTFTDSLHGLFAIIREARTAMITCSSHFLRSDIVPAGVTSYGWNKVLHVVARSVNKGTAAQQIADTIEIDLGTVLAAGNDKNDTPMLTLRGLGCPVLVGNAMGDEAAHLPSTVHRLPDARTLAEFVSARVTFG